MGKHDEIVRSLNRSKLDYILSIFFGEPGVWGPTLGRTKVEDIKNLTFNDIKLLEQLIGKKSWDVPGNGTLKSFFEECNNSNERLVKEMSVGTLEIQKKIEFPLIKGNGQYKCTKGYIDLIVHAKPKGDGLFSTYQEITPIEFLIEVKKKEDLSDIGGIIRQINEYREYYNSCCNKYSSDIIDQNQNIECKTIWCLLIDEFDEKYREMFNDEKIEIISLKEIKKIKKETDALNDEDQKEVIKE